MFRTIHITFNFARYLALIILCYITAPMLHAQQQSEYLSFETTGIEGSQVKTITQGKFVRVLTTGGYVNVHLTDLFKTTSGINGRVYNKQQAVYNSLNKSLYLYPGNEYFLDVFETATDKLLKRYILQRPKLYPQIAFYKNDGSRFFQTKPDGKDAQLNLVPNDRIKLEIIQPKDFNEMMVEYSLRNLETKQIERGSSAHAFKELTFAGNTDYELRINYVVQRESTSIIYIHVKPHWYQSYLTYGILLVILMLITAFLIRLRFQKKISSSIKEQQRLEQAAIRLQSLLNPHFTFNALSSIQGLMNTNRIDEANQYLQEFSALLRQTLANSQQVYTSLSQELDTMRLYIKLEAFRFNFSWQIEVSPDLDPSAIEVPTLLLQPLIENAVKHGLSKLGNQGKLYITCTRGQKKDTFVVSIKDNGTWINKTDLGYGLALTQERITTMNALNKGQHITLAFEKIVGTNAILTFHNWID
jgi:two-component system LytT family sensor kinase